MWSEWTCRFRGLFRRRAVEQELDDELRFHMEQHIRKSVEAGVPRAEAGRRARIAFGGVAQVQEECRDERGVSWIENAGRDLAYAARVLRKSPGFACIALLILALGIGANTTAFSFVNAILLKKLPVDRPEELVILRYHMDGHGPFNSFRYAELSQLERTGTVFSGVFGRGGLTVHLTADDTATRAYGELVSADYFGTLGVRASLGRTLNSEDNGAEDISPVCVISWRLWQERFAGDPAVLNRVIQLDSHPFSIVGVLQPGFRGTELQARRDLFVPMSMTRMFMGMKRDDQGWTWLQIMGRLKPGATRAQAAAAMNVLKPHGPRSVMSVGPGEQGIDATRSRLGDPALLSMGAVGLVLLIACANLAGLLLARSSARRREFAVRLSLGATRGRLVRQLLAECALLAVGGAAASILVSAWLMRLLLNFLQDAQTNTSLLVALDPAALAFTAILAGVTVAAFGLLPAWSATRLDVNAGLKDQPAAFSYGTSRLRQGLIVVQLAMGLVLLFGAGVLTRTLRNLETIDLGFDLSHVVTIATDPGKSGYNRAAAKDFYERLESEARKIPAVQSAGLSQIGALSGGMFAAMVRVAGHTEGRDDPNNNYNIVSPGYFRTLGVPFLAGRDFTAEDRAGAPAAAIVNEQFVKFYWPGQNAIGRHIGCLGKDYEIVGVVKTAIYQNLRETPQITIYLPLAQKPLYPLTLHVRTTANPELIMARLRDVVRGIDPKLPVTASTLVGARDTALARERMLAFLSGFLAVLATALVAIGLYGLIAYSAERRIKEIGLRLALGARYNEIVWLFLRESLVLVGLGLGLGLPLALASARVLKSVVFNVPAVDPMAIAVGAGALMVVSLAAALLPSWRASRQDPMTALRHD